MEAEDSVVVVEMEVLALDEGAAEAVDLLGVAALAVVLVVLPLAIMAEDEGGYGYSILWTPAMLYNSV